MLNQDEQVALFVEAINKDAEKLCKKIDKETKKLYSSEVEKIQKKAEEQMIQRINYHKNEIETDFNKSLALSKAGNRQLLCDKRQSVTESVFEEVRESIAVFTQSEAYTELLEKSLREICSYVDGDMEVFARSTDMEKVSAVAEKAGLQCEVKADDSITLGGIKVISEKTGKIFDDTLDQRLEEQRDWFLSNSKLSVNI